MRLLYIHQHFCTPKGAAGTRSYAMARSVVENGHSVLMVCGSYGIGNTGLTQPFERRRRRGVVDGIDVIEFDLAYANTDGLLKRAGTFMRFASGCIGVVFKERYDLVFATTTPLTAGIPGIVARWLKRKPFVFEVRDLWPELPREMGVITNPLILWALSALEWCSYRSANRCVALSPGIAKGIARRGVPEEKITLIPNGCDIEIFGNQPLVVERPQGVGPDDLMVVFTGTHGVANGLDAVLDAAAVLKKNAVDSIKIVLIGHGKLKPRLVARATQEGLDNVIFLDPVSKLELAGLMASADIGLQCLANIQAFYYGTSPNKFFDYLAAGLPVVNNYPGWLAELINENECGYVVPPDNAEAFAAALKKADENRQDLEVMSEHCRELARREFDRDQLAQRWVDWVLFARTGPAGEGTASSVTAGVS